MDFSSLQQLNHSNNTGLKNVRKSLTAQFNFKEHPLSWVDINNERLYLAGGFKYFLFSSLFWKDSQID